MSSKKKAAGGVAGLAASFLSVPRAAEILGCTDVWVLKMVHRGELEGFRVNGRAWAITTASVEKNKKEYEERDSSLAGRKRSRA